MDDVGFDGALPLFRKTGEEADLPPILQSLSMALTCDRIPNRKDDPRPRQGHRFRCGQFPPGSGSWIDDAVSPLKAVAFSRR